MPHTQIGDVFRGSITGSGEPTPFDLPNIGDLSDKEIESYIRSKIRDDLESPFTFEKLNRVYAKSLQYLEEDLFYSKTELNRLKKQIPFKDISDLIGFLKKTTTKTGRMNCVIAKVFQSFYDCDVEFNNNMRLVKDKTQGVIDGKLIKPLRVLRSNDEEYSGEEYYESNTSGVRKIPYKLKKRVKSIESTVSKEIRDPKYFSIERTSDMHGLTFEVENKDDIMPLMQMIAGYVFKKGEYEIKNDKGMFSSEDIYENTEVSDDFKERVFDGTKSRDKPESGDVVDIKLVTPKNKGSGIKNMNIEIKFIVVKNQNEYGLNMHGIYNYAKKIKEKIRLDGYISHDYFETLADKFLENISDLLFSNVGRTETEGDDIYPYKKELFNDLKAKNFIDSSVGDLRNPHVKNNIDKYLKSGLVQYYRSKLTPVNINHGTKVYYSNERAIEMVEKGLGGNILKSIRD